MLSRYGTHLLQPGLHDGLLHPGALRMQLQESEAGVLHGRGMGLQGEGHLWTPLQAVRQSAEDCRNVHAL